MSDLTAFQNAGVPANIDDIKSRLQHARQQAPVTGGGVQFLKMNQVGSPAEGLLTYGAEQTEVEEGSVWAVNWKGIQHGYLLRDGGSVNAEAWAPVFEPLPAQASLQPPRGREQWKQGYKAQLVCISGEDLGTVVEYSGDAGGVVKLFKDVLLPGIEKQLDVDVESLYPAITFEVTSYYSDKQKKTIYEAHGTIVQWLGEGDLQAALSGAMVGSAGAADPSPSTPDSGPAFDPDPAPAPQADPPAHNPGARRQRRRKAS